ncbi:FAD-dependent oxidoreductase [Nocardia sp. NPDC052566]|uniref:hydroxysqualene dehydroxylase n=1 Tax=Nocardia sp. NPDC052566 TaxID=3364330 RepID=UPI0037C939FC
MLSRRSALGISVAAVTGLGAAVLGAPAQAVPRRGGGRDVAVFGGGMAGLAAAHELIERGYRVTVYEPAFLGGKARSLPVPGTGSGGRLDLPGEHGFRFFPGCYQHVPDTMARIPLADRGNVKDSHLVAIDSLMVAFDSPDYAPVLLPGGIQNLVEHPDMLATAQNFQNAVATVFHGMRDIPTAEVTYFASRIAVMATSCRERRLGQWENQSWMEFVGAEGKSERYRLLSHAATRTTIAAKADTVSARTVGQIGVALLTASTGLIPQYSGNPITGGADRVLNLPTNEAWIDPWVTYLRSRGVSFVMGCGLRALHVRDGLIASASMTAAGDATSEVTADWYVVAIPLDRLKLLLDAALLDAAPSLEGIRHLDDDWMAGMQFFLGREPELPSGHIAILGSPWALTAIFQSSSWQVDFAARYGDGSVRECLSVDISAWDAPGILFGRTAKECSREEIAKEVWEQLRRGLNRGGAQIIRDADLLRWHLDPGITWTSDGIGNATPLLVNHAGSYRHRPDAATEIPNLFLGGDHVRTNIDLATMEGANESGRRAANAVLDAAGDPSPRVPIYPLWEAPALEPLQQLDRDRYRAGLPHILDR